MTDFEADVSQFEEDPRLLAAVDMVGRTGASFFQIRYCDEEEPVIWSAVARYGDGAEARYEATGGMTPAIAVFRLCEALMDGGRCLHCGRPTGFNEDASPMINPGNLICFYSYDPELKTYRRNCEGQTGKEGT